VYRRLSVGLLWDNEFQPSRFGSVAAGGGGAALAIIEKPENKSIYAE